MTSRVSIKKSVGKGGVNASEDVYPIQVLLNKFVGHGRLRGVSPIVLNGLGNDAATVKAITIFQTTYVPVDPDGRVDPWGTTLEYLNYNPLTLKPQPGRRPRPGNESDWRYSGSYGGSLSISVGDVVSGGHTTMTLTVRHRDDPSNSFEVLCFGRHGSVGAGAGSLIQVEYSTPGMWATGSVIQRLPAAGSMVEPEDFEGLVLVSTVSAGNPWHRMGGAHVVTIPKRHKFEALAMLAGSAMGSSDAGRRLGELSSTSGFVAGHSKNHTSAGAEATRAVLSSTLVGVTTKIKSGMGSGLAAISRRARR